MTGSAFWTKMAPRYAAQAMGNPAAYEASLARITPHLRADAHVVELGCGTASTALRLAPDVGTYLATDYSSGMIAQAQARLDAGDPPPNLSLMQAGVGEADLAARGPFDVVLAFNMLHLLTDMPGGLAWIRNQVKPGGLFISKTVCLRGQGVKLRHRLIMLALPLLQALGKAPQFNRLSREGLEGAITSAGFEIIETGDYPDSPPGRLVIARRAD